MTSLYGTAGALIEPFDAADVDDAELTFAAADPAQRLLLDLIATALQSELGAAWGKVVATFPATHPLFGKGIVATKHPMTPTPSVVKALGSSYPALFVHRTGKAQYSAHTLHLDKRVQSWQVHWIVGGLANEEQAKIYGALQRVSDVIAQVVRRKGHPDFRSGHTVLATDADGFSGVRIVEAEVGPASFAENEETFLASLTVLESTELIDEQREHLETLQYSTFDVALGDMDDELAHFIELDTRHGPDEATGASVSGFTSGFTGGFH